jgi:thiol-disulfide isomerase/thioredoxin
MWGTPVVGPSGAVSYQLPPQPLLDLFRQPSDETARAYLQVWKDKAGRREAAFAALRRMAAELGFERDPHTLDDPTSSVAPALELSSPEATSLSASGSFPLSLGEATPLVRRTHTPVSPPSVGTAPSARPATNTPAAVSTAPLPVLQAATATQEMQGQQMRIFYFFSPRCPYCAQQTPLLNSFAQGRRDMVGIAMDTEREELLAHVQQMRITFPVMLDQGESRRFGVTAYPTLVVLDAEGKATRLQGLLTREELERALGGGA